MAVHAYNGTTSSNNTSAQTYTCMHTRQQNKHAHPHTYNGLHAGACPQVGSKAWHRDAAIAVLCVCVCVRRIYVYMCVCIRVQSSLSCVHVYVYIAYMCILRACINCVCKRVQSSLSCVHVYVYTAYMCICACMHKLCVHSCGRVCVCMCA